MWKIEGWCLGLLSLGFLACGAMGQATGEVDIPRADTASKTPASKPVNVCIIGASVSFGFVAPFAPKPGKGPNRTLRLQKVLKKVWQPEQVKLRNFANFMMFQKPEELGAGQLKRMQRRQPDVVLALDYMFWFGYGAVLFMSGEEKEAHRLALQKKAFAQLETLDCPILLGDYPDMRGADPRMLPPSAVPSPEVLAPACGPGRPSIRMCRSSPWPSLSRRPRNSPAACRWGRRKSPCEPMICCSPTVCIPAIWVWSCSVLSWVRN